MAALRTTKKLDDTERETLILVCAATDSAFMPSRDFNSRRWAASSVARQGILAGKGVTWRGTGEQSVSRSMAALEDAGLICRIKGSAGAKTTNVSITPHGYSLARRLCKLTGLADAVEFMKFIAGHIKRKECTNGDCGPAELVSEARITGVMWGDPKARDEHRILEDLLLPALVSGWVVAMVTTGGQVWYALQTSGEEVMATMSGVPLANAFSLPPADEIERNREIYTAAEKSSLLALEADTSTGSQGRDIGDIPLSASTWEQEASRRTRASK